MKRQITVTSPISVSLIHVVVTATAAGGPIELTLPDEIDTSAVYDASTTVLLNVMPSLRPLVTDLDDDGDVTDHDVRLWITGEIADRLEVRDFDGDGLVTASDEVYAVKTLLDRLRGDVDGTGTIGVLDTAAFLDLYLQPDPDALAFVNRPSADMNLDGAVTSDDLVEHIAAVAAPAAQIDTTRVAVDLLANVRGTLTADYYLQGHVFEISSTYPEHDVNNSRIPRGHPRVPNHDHGISVQWQHGNSTSKHWPPNHNWVLSNSWSEPEPGHNLPWSGTRWPANHHRDFSIDWSPDGPGNAHSTSASRLWPPNHGVIFSQTTTPTQHDASISPIYDQLNPPDGDPPADWDIPSFEPQRAPHDLWASGTWTRHDFNTTNQVELHQADISRLFWPANHEIVASSTWNNSTAPHLANISMTWPSNHLRAVSKGWPQDDQGPRDWPSNHGATVSGTWPNETRPNEPFDWPRWFPEGHSVYTTTREIIPFLPWLSE